MTAAEPGQGATEFAPAKVNLYLHLTGRRADGYHLLESLVVFPAIGDRLSVVPGPPGSGLSLNLAGPFAEGLEAGHGNLVLRAARALAEAHEVRADLSLTLEKRLPVASGIGGGSSDAAAALRLLSRLWDVPVPPGLAVRLGADVPVCLGAPASQFMAGIGEVLRPGPDLPDCWMVLVNPGQTVETAAVFRSVERRENAPADTPPERVDFDGLVDWLSAQRNDLRVAACQVCPAIGEVLSALGDAPFASMSGSGATCFALHPDRVAAERQAEVLRGARPGWWVEVAGVGTAPLPNPPPDGGRG